MEMLVPQLTLDYLKMEEFKNEKNLEQYPIVSDNYYNEWMWNERKRDT